MKLDKKPICIVDNNPNMLGTIENNLKVENPEIISNIKNKVLNYLYYFIFKFQNN